MVNKDITALLIDTDLKAIDLLASLLDDIPFVNVVGKVNDPMVALAAIGTLKPDVIFLEIDMLRKNGFDIINEMVRFKFSSRVVLCNANADYSIKAIRNSVFDYLLKPIEKTELLESVFRLQSLFIGFRNGVNHADSSKGLDIEKANPHEKIQFSSGNGFIMVKPEEILYVLAEWNYSEIFFSLSRSELTTSNLGSVEKNLEGRNFYRVNRSIIINLSYLWKVNRKKRVAILQKNGEEFSCKIPVCGIRKMEKYLTNDM